MGQGSSSKLLYNAWFLFKCNNLKDACHHLYVYIYRPTDASGRLGYDISREYYHALWIIFRESLPREFDMRRSLRISQNNPVMINLSMKAISFILQLNTRSSHLKRIYEFLVNQMVQWTLGYFIFSIYLLQLINMKMMFLKAFSSDYHYSWFRSLYP